MFKRVAHICIGSNDLKETERFYCDVLGMEKKFDFVKDDELYGYYIDVGDTTFIEVFKQGATTNHDHPII